MPASSGHSPSRGKDKDFVDYVARRTPVPARLVQVFRDQYDSDRPDPAPGQVWRLEWDGTVAVAVLSRVDDDLVHVIPVGDDPEFADPATVVVGTERSPLGYSVGLWVASERPLPRVVLDLPFGSLSDDDFDLIMTVRRAMRTGQALPDDPRLGQRLPGNAGLDHPRLAYRVELDKPFFVFAEVFALLDQVRAGDTKDPETITSEEAASGPTQTNIEALAKDAGLVLREIAAALGLNPRQALELKRGNLFLTDEQITKLASLLGLSAEKVVKTLFSEPDLLVRLHQPRSRAQLQLLAQRRGIPDSVARRKAIERLVPAGRRERRGSKPNWDELLDRYFAEDA